jgi:hypothetical protein
VGGRPHRGGEFGLPSICSRSTEFGNPSNLPRQ